MNVSLSKTLDDFVAQTVKSRIAVVVPLYGYWTDGKSDQLNAETLRLSLDRAYSSVHQVYFIFVAEVGRLDKNVSNALVKYERGGNCKGVAMRRGDTYADYVREGFKVALEETNAEFIVNINPWLLFQHNGLDILIDRVNREDIKVACGYDLRGVVEPEAFDNQIFQIPSELHLMSLDFMCMKRLTAEMVPFDQKYKTHYFLSRDVWQGLFNKGFLSITSQRVPIFTFEVDWKELESVEDFEADKAYFISKHRFDPDIKYE